MTFDPEKFLKETEPAFDPDQFLADTAPKPVENERTGEAALEGLGQGLTLGYLAQLQAKAEPLTDRLFNAVTGNETEAAPMSQLYSNDKNYLESRDANVQRQDQLKEKNPYVYGGSEIAGNVIGGLAVAPLATAGKAGKLKQAAMIGGAYGFLTNPGDVQGVVDELQVGSRLKNALVGTITGYGAQVGIDKIAKYSKGLAKTLVNKANERAIKKQAKLEMSMAPGSTKGTIRPSSGKDVLSALKDNADSIRPNSKTKATNKVYSEMGLEDLSPVQMQAKVAGEPTPAQYAEALLKSKDVNLYNKQLKQSQSLDNVLEKFKEVGAPNRETFGASVNSQIDDGLKAAGKTIGEFKDSISANKIDKRSLFMKLKDARLDPSKFEKSDLNKLQGYMNRVFNSKNAQELDNVMGLIGAESDRAFTQYGSGTPYTRALGKIKKGAEGFIEEMLPDGKPREAYRQYAMVKNLYKDTLKGGLKTGGDDKVLRNITKTAQNFRQFKDMATTLKKPELIEGVKENYISEIFNQRNWRSALKKAKKTQVYDELLSDELKSRLNTILRYDEQMSSTMSKTVNPSKSGFVNNVVKIIKDPRNSLDLIMGDERKMSKALTMYNKLIKKEIKAADPENSLILKAGKLIGEIPQLGDISDDNPMGFQAIVNRLVSKDNITSNSIAKKKRLEKQEQWIARGINNLTKEFPEINMENERVANKLLFTTKGEGFLKRASSLKPNSRAMASLKKDIDNYLKESK